MGPGMCLRSLLAVLVLAGAMVGCMGPPSYNWKAENALGYRIGPGDQLKVVVWKHDELSTQVAVRPDGAISLPLVGDVPATGRSASEIAADVQTRLHRFYQDDPPVTRAGAGREVVQDLRRRRSQPARASSRRARR